MNTIALKKMGLSVLAFAAILATAGCGGKDAKDAAASVQPSATAKAAESDKPKELVKLRLANLAVGLSSAYHQLGVEKGIFKKYGIDLQIVNFAKGGAEATAGVASGQVDMGSYGTPILTGIAKGLPIKVVGSPAIKGNPFVLVAKKGITSVKDLKGKTIATGAFGGGNHQSFVKTLEANGLKESDVKVIATGGADEFLILQSGKVDAVQTSEPTASRIVAEGVGDVLVKAKDIYGEYQHSFVFATNDFAKNHPETVRNFFKASRESYQYSKDHFEELVAKGKTLVQLDEKIIREYYKNDIADWDLSFKVNVKGTENAFKIVQGLGEIDKNVTFDPNTWLDQKFLE